MQFLFCFVSQVLVYIKWALLAFVSVENHFSNIATLLNIFILFENQSFKKLQKETESGGPPIGWYTPQQLQLPGLSQVEAWRQQLQPALWRPRREPEHLGHLPLPFPHCKQGTGSEMEKPGHKQDWGGKAAKATTCETNTPSRHWFRSHLLQLTASGLGKAAEDAQGCGSLPPTGEIPVNPHGHCSQLGSEPACKSLLSNSDFQINKEIFLKPC